MLTATQEALSPLLETVSKRTELGTSFAKGFSFERKFDII